MQDDSFGVRLQKYYIAVEGWITKRISFQALYAVGLKQPHKK
jgi:hypothetical protein